MCKLLFPTVCDEYAPDNELGMSRLVTPESVCHSPAHVSTR